MQQQCVLQGFEDQTSKAGTRLGKAKYAKTSRFTWFLRKVGVTPCGLLSSRGLIGSPLFGAKNHVKRDVFAIFALSWAWLQLSLEFPILGLVAAFA